MRFTIKREEFLKGLLIAGRAISPKTPMPVLINLKIELNEMGLYITGSNFDITIKTIIPYKRNDVEIIRNFKEGSTLISAKYITEIVRKMESEEITIDVVDTTIATLNDNKSEYHLNCVRTEEYPDLDLEPNGTQLTLKREVFSDLVSQTAFAASTKEQRPIWTAINLVAADGILIATATDGGRMAKKTISVPNEINFVSNVPAKTMVEVEHLIEGVEELSVAFSDKKALFSFDGTVVSTRLVSGDYPPTSNVVPRVINHSLEVNANDLMKAIDRANVISVDRVNVVTLSMSKDSVEISAKSSQVGSAIERLENFKYDGEPLKVAFNTEFVLAAIRVLNTEDVTLSFVGEMKPFVIKNASDDSIIQIVSSYNTY